MPGTPDLIIRDEIRALSAYHVADSRGLVKLDAMENPYVLPDAMARQIAELSGAQALNRYPDPTAPALKGCLRQAMGVPDDMDVLLGNGSDELIQVLALAVNRPGAVLLSVEPSFVMYRMVATFVGMRYIGVALANQFDLDLPATLKAIEAHRPALIFLAYPNNPTGNLFDVEAMERILAAAPGLVVVDEAYHAFAGASFLGRLARHPHLLVMRTLSKLGLAGLRLGMLIGRREWLAELDKVRLPYNVNVLSQRVAEHVLGQPEVLQAQVDAIRRERARLAERLGFVAGVQVFPSQANFILLRVPRADMVFATLKTRGILVKNLNGAHPMLADCLRVTVGTPEENARFEAALQDALARAA
jgi:histidinol-phosphate aminotransferase